MAFICKSDHKTIKSKLNLKINSSLNSLSIFLSPLISPIIMIGHNNIGNNSELIPLRSYN